MMTTSAAPHNAIRAGKPAGPIQGPFTRWPRSSDAMLAFIVFVLEVVGIFFPAPEGSGNFDISMLGDVSIATYLLLAASSIALLWRRRWPLLVAVATLSASLVWDLMGLAGGPSLAIFVSMYGVGRYIEQDQPSLAAVAVALVLALTDDFIEAEASPVIGLSVALVVVPWYVGRRVRVRRDYLALLEERAAYLEREKVAEAQRAVDEERTRIARELHDLVAHRVSLITVQAGAAQTVASSDPERAIRAMASVEEAGREALNELRQILGVLRSAEEREDLVPVHGAADIKDLVTEMRGAGMRVSLSGTEVPRGLPTGVDLASYRIVQEALTNVLKHAGPDPEVDVRVTTDGQMLTIEVTNRGVGVSTLPGSGHGLVGMRERAALLGGTFEAGPRPGGGFRVLARLPLERSSS